MTSILLVIGFIGAAFAGAGAYLEHKFGSKVSADVTALEARVSSVEASIKGSVAAKVGVVESAAKQL